MFRIRVLARIQICIRILGSLPLIIRIFFFIFLCFSFLKVRTHLHYSLKIKIHKKSQNSRNQDFSSFFSWLMEGSGSGSGSVLIVYGSECDPGGLKTYGSYGPGFGTRLGRGECLILTLRFVYMLIKVFPYRVRNFAGTVRYPPIGNKNFLCSHWRFPVPGR